MDDANKAFRHNLFMGSVKNPLPNSEEEWLKYNEEWLTGLGMLAQRISKICDISVHSARTLWALETKGSQLGKNMASCPAFYELLNPKKIKSDKNFVDVMSQLAILAK